jgi:hypothetical protein
MGEWRQSTVVHDHFGHFAGRLATFPSAVTAHTAPIDAFRHYLPRR